MAITPAQYATMISRNSRVNHSMPNLPSLATKESDLHKQIIAECNSNRWYYVHSRMDRRPTQAKGVPDFIIAVDGGRTLWIEAKAKGKKATPEQLGALMWLNRSGHTARLVHSIEEFRAIAYDTSPENPAPAHQGQGHKP